MPRAAQRKRPVLVLCFAIAGLLGRPPTRSLGDETSGSHNGPATRSGDALEKELLAHVRIGSLARIATLGGSIEAGSLPLAWLAELVGMPPEAMDSVDGSQPLVLALANPKRYGPPARENERPPLPLLALIPLADAA